jgi:hypothetical protein
MDQIARALTAPEDGDIFVLGALQSCSTSGAFHVTFSSAGASAVDPRIIEVTAIRCQALAIGTVMVRDDDTSG